MTYDDLNLWSRSRRYGWARVHSPKWVVEMESNHLLRHLTICWSGWIGGIVVLALSCTRRWSPASRTTVGGATCSSSAASTAKCCWKINRKALNKISKFHLVSDRCMQIVNVKIKWEFVSPVKEEFDCMEQYKISCESKTPFTQSLKLCSNSTELQLRIVCKQYLVDFELWLQKLNSIDDFVATLVQI